MTRRLRALAEGLRLTADLRRAVSTVRDKECGMSEWDCNPVPAADVDGPIADCCDVCDHRPRVTPESIRAAQAQIADAPYRPVHLRRRTPPEIIARAAEILEAAMHDIDRDKGAVSPSSWGSLLAALAILRADHGLGAVNRA